MKSRIPRIAIVTALALLAVPAVGNSPVKAASSQEAHPAPDGASDFLALGENLSQEIKAKEVKEGTSSATSTGGTKKAPASGSTYEGMSAEEINNQLNNPGAALAQLNFKLTWNHYTGNLPGSSSQDSMTMLFQPVVPFKLSDGGNFILRPTIPVTWTPHFSANHGSFDEEFGLGDVQLNAFYSRTDMEKGYMWGAGVAMQAPTHTDPALGKDQFLLGPAAFVGLMGKWGSGGVFPQHMWNIGGSSEGYTAVTNIQPWYWFNVGDGYQIGGSPVIVYDWAADDSDEAWTVPINLGIAKTFMFGKTPVKIKFEAIYYLTQPDSFGPKFGFQLTFTPVVPNTLGHIFK